MYETLAVVDDVPALLFSPVRFAMLLEQLQADAVNSWAYPDYAGHRFLVRAITQRAHEPA